MEGHIFKDTIPWFYDDVLAMLLNPWKQGNLEIS
jgi:hypothetical protein